MANALLRAGRLLARAARRFATDEAPTRAAALTYTTLLSLVPFLAVFFATLSGLGRLLGTEARLEAFPLEHLLPGSAAATIQYLTRFTQKTAAVGAVGFLALVVTALLMLNTIEGVFRHIYRLPEGRSIRQRLLSYWTMLTVAPVLLGLSFYVSGRAHGLASVIGAAGMTEVLHERSFLRAFLVPLVTTWGAFTVAYLVLPATQVRAGAAAGGALVAALLWETAKSGFDWYVAHFASFERLYGAVALLPIFLIWIHLSWLVVIFGAEVAFCLQHPDPGPADVRPLQPRPAPGPLAARLLWIVARDFAAGRGRPTVERAAGELGVHADEAARGVAALEAAGLLARTLDPADTDAPAGLLPARPLGEVTVADALRAGEASGGGRGEGAEPDSPVLGLLAEAEAEAAARLERETYGTLVAAWRAAPAAAPAAGDGAPASAADDRATASLEAAVEAARAERQK